MISQTYTSTSYGRKTCRNENEHLNLRSEGRQLPLYEYLGDNLKYWVTLLYYYDRALNLPLGRAEAGYAVNYPTLSGQRVRKLTGIPLFNGSD